MNKELALRTFAYLIGHYKTHNATIINKQEIEAIEFILKDNEFLKQQLHEASLTIQEMTEQDIECPSNCEKLEKLQQENKKIKKQLENYKKLGFKYLQDKNNNLEKQQKEFINYLEDEKDRLARECSNVYEDSLGHTRLVNEDIFDEINDVLQKYKEIIGDDK